MGSKATETNITSLGAKWKQFKPIAGEQNRIKMGFDFFFERDLNIFKTKGKKSKERQKLKIQKGQERINSIRLLKRWETMRSRGHREGLSLGKWKILQRDRKE